MVINFRHVNLDHNFIILRCSPLWLDSCCQLAVFFYDAICHCMAWAMSRRIGKGIWSFSHPFHIYIHILLEWGIFNGVSELWEQQCLEHTKETHLSSQQWSQLSNLILMNHLILESFWSSVRSWNLTSPGHRSPQWRGLVHMTARQSLNNSSIYFGWDWRA